jgi:hypothetical protein
LHEVDAAQRLANARIRQHAIDEVVTRLAPGCPELDDDWLVRAARRSHVIREQRRRGRSGGTVRCTRDERETHERAHRHMLASRVVLRASCLLGIVAIVIAARPRPADA